MADQPAARGNAPEHPPVTPILRSGGETLRGHTGPLEYRPTDCQALVEDGTQGCRVRATWRVTAHERDETGPVTGRWLICQPHLGETIMLVDDTYGGPVVVTRA
jgi:hypothetical protein